MTVPNLFSRLQASDSQIPAHDVAISTRVRLARNLDEPFLLTMNMVERRLLRDRLFDLIGDCNSINDAIFLREEALAPHEVGYLAEVNLLDREEAGREKAVGLIYLKDPCQMLVIGLEDHLSIRCRASGLNLEDAWMQADRIDNALEERLDFAFSENFGYLSPDPRHTGTGLEISCLLHLPALSLGDDLQRVFRGLTALNMVVAQPAYWSTPAQGTYFLLANARGLGRKEQDFLETMVNTVNKLAEFEAKARDYLLSEARALLEEHVWSAFGQLKYGRCIDDMKANELLGNIRLGVLSGIIQNITLHDVELIRSQTGTGRIHYQAGETLDETTTSQIRAKLLRRWLAERESGRGKDNSL
ncbi:MAG: hypothetical protein GY835_21575 [bacterium]|nr:hypothetical protein [bacterium]